jgi:hypothetical protein
MDDGGALIDDAMLALMQRRVSIMVAARDAALRPHLMRAVGCRVSADRRRVGVLLPRATAQAVLDGIAAHRAVAVVISEPSTHRSLQLKGDDAVVEPLAPGDVSLMDAYAGRFADELALIGIARPLALAILDRGDGDVRVVGFTPTQAYEQTPGPRAGHALGSA